MSREEAAPAGRSSNVVAMPAVLLATEVWHWWIGVILFAVSVLAVIGLVGGYLKNVTAQRYPNKRQRDQQCRPCSRSCWLAARSHLRPRP